MLLFFDAILLRIYVCHIQDLRNYPVALQTHSGYNESVSQRSFPRLLVSFIDKKDMKVQRAGKRHLCTKHQHNHKRRAYHGGY